MLYVDRASLAGTESLSSMGIQFQSFSLDYTYVNNWMSDLRLTARQR